MTWTRRQALRSAASTLWLPLLPSALPRSAWAATPAEAQRLLIYFVANGLVIGDGSDPAQDPDNHGVLEPLDPMAARRTIVTGLENKTVGPSSVHESCTPSLLTDVVPENYFEPPFDVGISCDQFAAAQVGQDTAFASLQLGVNTTFKPVSPNANTYSSRISWADPETPMPPTEVPKQLFDAMFAGYDPDATEEEIARRNDLRKSVLDSVLDQVKSLEARLNPTDRAKLDQYTTGMRELEQRIDTLQQNACPVPDAPSTALDYVGTVDAFVDLMVVALECDYSRILTFMSAPSSSYQVYSWLGQTKSHHPISHQWKLTSEDEQFLVGINRWHAEVVNGLAERLAAIESSDGSDLLSNTLLVLTSEFSDPSVHDSHPLPFVLIGGESGGVAQGRHLHFEGDSHANLLRSMIAYTGADPGQFGPNNTGTIDLS